MSDRKFDHADLNGLLKYVFTYRKSDIRYSFLVTYLILTGGRAFDLSILEKNPLLQKFGAAFHAWLTGCLVRGENALPPVRNTVGMVFVSDILDRAEGHLHSLGRLREALRISALRGMSDAVFQRQSPVWVLSASYVGHIGHLIYAATLIELQRNGKLTDQEIRILSKPSANNYLRGFFEAYLVDSMPPGAEYAETMTTRKRHYMADGCWATMSELVSEAAQFWATERPFASVDPETRARGDAALAALGVPPDAPIVTLHVREPGFVRDRAESAGLRDARIADYRAAIAHLTGTGTYVIRLGDRSMTPVEPQAWLVDYPFTDAKADWMDIYLASRCRFHIGTSSGMSFVPLLFGRPVLFTNWITMAHVVCASNVLTLPKILVDRDGAVVPMAAYCGRHGQILERTDAVLHGLTFRDNTPDDLVDAVRLMDEHIDRGTGRLDLPAGLCDEPAAVFAASPLRIRPQIPPAFWRRHYAGRAGAGGRSGAAPEGR